MSKQPHFESDQELMRRSSGGDRAAFETLYDRYFAKLVWFAMQQLNDRPRSEDVVQEVFIKIIERPELFDRERKFSTWIYTITANACRNIIRNETRRIELNRLNDLGEQMYEHGQSRHDMAFFKKKFDTLYAGFSEKEKTIFTLRFEQELTIKEIAGIVNLPIGSVKSCIFYILKKLAQLKRQYYEQ